MNISRREAIRSMITPVILTCVGQSACCVAVDNLVDFKLLPGTQNLGYIDDIEYFRKNLYTALSIPKAIRQTALMVASHNNYKRS